VHPFPRGAHDGAILDPQRAVAHRRARHAEYVAQARLQSLPGAHGFDDFYGIPPDATWNIALDVPQVQQTHSIEAQEKALVDKGPWIMSQRAAGALQPNYPSKQFAGKSRIGQYGDKMLEGDYHVGQILDALKELKIENETIVVFASDNGPWGWEASSLGNLGSLDMGSRCSASSDPIWWPCGGSSGASTSRSRAGRGAKCRWTEACS